MSNIILTQEQFDKVVEAADDFTYLGDENGNYKEYPASEVSTQGKVGDDSIYGKKNTTTDKYAKNIVKQDWWWRDASTSSNRRAVGSNLPMDNIKEESSIPSAEIPDSITQKLEVMMPLINNKNKYIRFSIVEKILNTIVSDDFDNSMRVKLRDILFNR